MMKRAESLIAGHLKAIALVVFLMPILTFFSFIVPGFADQGEENTTIRKVDENIRTVRVGLYENAPKIFTGADGNASGFWPDIIRHIAAEEGWEVKWVPGTWQQGLERLADNRIDMMPDTGWTEPRSRIFAFSQETVLLSWSQLYTRKGIDIDSIMDLKGKTIGALAGSFNLNGPKGIKEITKAFEIDCTFVEMDDYTSVFRALENGQIDAAVTNKDFGNRYERSFDIERTAIVFQPARMQFAFTKNAASTPYLIEKIDAHILVLKKDSDSVYHKSLDKWIAGHHSEKLLPTRVKWIGFTAIGLCAVLVLGNIFLRVKVRSRTRSLKHEIDSRKQALKALKESEGKYRLLAENVTDAICVINLDRFSFDYVSPSFESLFGYTPEEAATLNIYDLLPPGSIERVKAVIGNEIGKEKHEKAEPQRLELEARCKDEKKIWTETSARFLRGGNKQTTSILCVIRNITERKLAEQALTDSEKKYRTVMEANPDPVVVYDMQGRVIYFNPAFTQVFGWALEECIERKMDMFVPVKAMPETKMMIDKVLLGEGFSGVETFRYTKKGEIIPVSISGAIYRDQNENPIGSIINLRDISEQKKIEKQLLQAQKMEAIGTLAGGIAHDFNNMLNVISGHTELALGQVDAAQAIHKNLEEINNATHRSAELTRQLLGFARKQTTVPKVLNLNHTISGMLSMLKRLIGEDIEVVWIPGTDLCPVKIDPAQIDQILVNLCVNARDAIAGMGRITIETERASLDGTYCDNHAGFVPGEYTMIAISDDGEGMDQTTQDKLFEPFFTTKKFGEGTGLGLSTVYGIMKQNNGFINVYSEPGKGTTFKAYFPRATDNIDSEEAPGDEIIAKGSETVLVVEDEKTILDLCKAALKQLGYKVLAFNTPIKALEAVERLTEPIQLLITDVVMPEMNGKDLKEQIETYHPDVRVLFMSGYTPNVIVHRGILERDVNFIQKPFSLNALAIKVREILDVSMDNNQ